MRPALKPGLLPVWRNGDTLQIGIDPRRAIALTGMRGVAGLLDLLDGSRDRGQILAAARELGIDAEAADRVLTLLAAGGALCDFPLTAFRAVPQGLRARLAPELATAALAYGDADGGARVLARRQAACIQVHGGSRAALCTGSLLTAAGVGMVVAGGTTAPDAAADAAAGDIVAVGTDLAGPGRPGGWTATGPAHRAGERRHRLRSDQGGRRPGGTRADGRRPDLVIIADDHQPEQPVPLMRDRVPHLAMAASEAIGVVGPFVLPGYTACLRCLDLARAERDPAWPRILAQLGGRSANPAACDAVLASAVAAQAAAAALSFIDRARPAGAVINGTLELVLPGWQWRRRSWQPHPQCGCDLDSDRRAGPDVQPSETAVASGAHRDREWSL